MVGGTPASARGAPFNRNRISAMAILELLGSHVARTVPMLLSPVVPAKAGTHRATRSAGPWVPAFAGTTAESVAPISQLRTTQQRRLECARDRLLALARLHGVADRDHRLPRLGQAPEPLGGSPPRPVIEPVAQRRDGENLRQ